MNIKTFIKHTLKKIYNYILTNPSKTIFDFIILFTGVGFIACGWNSPGLLIYSAIITGLLIFANYWKGHILYRYIFSIAAIGLFYTIIQFHPMKLVYLQSLAFYIPLITAYLLPDVISTNIVGIILAELFSTYFGKDDSNIILTDIIGIIYASIVLSISFYLFRKLNSEKNKYLKASLTDSLTGLYTLKYFLETGQKILDRNHETAVLLIDLDNFKQVNDRFGHAEGDRILIETAKILKDVVRTEGFVVRFGGDEFAIVLYDTNNEHMVKVASAILEKIRRLKNVENHKWSVISVSMGGVICEKQNETELSLFERADKALYQSKKAGKDQYSSYHEVASTEEKYNS